MIAWIYNLIVGQFCNHKWETIDRVNLIEGKDSIPYGFKVRLRCTKCGNWKSKSL